MALRILRRRDSRLTSQVPLPDTLVRTLDYALVRAWRSSGAARDSVADLYPIHTLIPATHRLAVFVDSGSVLARAWREGRRLSASLRADALVTAFGLHLSGYYDDSTRAFDVAQLESDDPLNAFALADLFRNVDGVLGAHAFGYLEPISIDIDARSAADHWRLDYGLGFGDCLSGCIGWHEWFFEVDTAGRVRYAGSSGDDLPPGGP